MALTKSLAPELVLRIFDFVDPPTLVLLACSCKFLEECSRDFLRKQKDTNARFRLVTDVDPRSITNVLRKAIINPGFAWHIRDLEISFARTQWSHWEGTKAEGDEDSAAVVPPDYAFTHDEQITLLDHLREIFRFDELDIDKARRDFQHGNDAPAKLLLFGFCPRIRSAKWARHFYLAGNSTLERETAEDLQKNPRSSLEYFHQAILTNLKTQTTAWPLGFKSLQDVAIGVDTRDKTSDVHFVPSPLLVASCTNLPHLLSLYCFGMDMPWNSEDSMDDSRARYNINKGSSSVQHLFLEGAHGDRTTQEVIVSGCKALKSLTISTCDMDDIDTLVALLKNCYKESFESLMFYTSDPRMRLHGYRRFVFETEVLSGMPNLRMLWIDPEDVIQDADLEYMSDMRWEQLANKHSWSCLEDVDFFVEFFMRNALPDSTEVLVLGSQSSSPLSEEEAEFFDHAIAALIEFGAANYLRERWRTCSCGRHPPPKFVRGSLPNPIKAVHLESMDVTDRVRGRRKRWFSKTFAAGRKHGVDVHTRTTRGPLFHRIEFPKPPLMVSAGSTSSSRDGPLVFNVYSGKWGPPGCGNCGKCEACLEQYDASVWREVEEELRQ
ncbi:hypothetical protein Q7P35_002916 [Cladosporium inversicolor]